MPLATAFFKNLVNLNIFYNLLYIFCTVRKITYLHNQFFYPRIKLGAEKPPKFLQEDSDEGDDSDEELTPEQRAIKREFENKRKKHYNEFYAVKLARKLLEEEEDDDEDDDNEKNASCTRQCASDTQQGTSKHDREK